MGQVILVLICAATSLVSSFLIFYLVFPRISGISFPGLKLIGGLIFAPLQGIVTAIAFGIALYFSSFTSIFAALGGGVAAVPVIFTFSLGITCAILFAVNLALLLVYKALGIIEIKGSYTATKAILTLMVLQVIACVLVTVGSAPFVKFDQKVTLIDLFQMFDTPCIYIDTKGRQVIDHKYRTAGSFKNGTAEVTTFELDSKRMFINHQGIEVPEPKVKKINSERTFFDEPSVFEYSDSASSIDTNELLSNDDIEGTSLSEGLAITRKKGTTKWGFIDVDANFKIEPQFADARHFKDGLAAVQIDSVIDSEKLWGYIDKTGKFVIPAKFVSAQTFSDGLALVSVQERFGKNKYEKYGFIDKTGKFVLGPGYKWARSFSEGVAAVCK